MKKEKLLEKIEQYKDEHGAKAAILDIIEPALENIKRHEMILSLTDRDNSGVLYMRLMDGEDRGIVIADNVGTAFSVALVHAISVYKRCGIPDRMIKHKLMRGVETFLEIINNGTDPRITELTMYGDRYDDDHQSN